MSDRETLEGEAAYRAGADGADGADGEEEAVAVVECPEDVIGYLSAEKLESILEEIVGFEVVLEEDPTLPDLGLRYLQSKIAQCRKYLNRVQYYLQVTKRYEKNLKRAAKVYELDLELKLAGLLADDAIVRRQSSIDDRKAVATTMLKQEHEVLSRFRVDIQNLDDTIKLVKSKYDDLRHTNGDIRLQRQLVKDDMAEWGSGEEGYTKPQSREDRTIPGGLPPPVSAEDIDPNDLLDPNKRPEDLPEPKNPSHAKQIAGFFGKKPVRHVSRGPADPAPEDPAPEDPAPAIQSVSYKDLLD